jgi:hypothetical protein
MAEQNYEEGRSYGIYNEGEWHKATQDGATKFAHFPFKTIQEAMDNLSQTLRAGRVVYLMYRRENDVIAQFRVEHLPWCDIGSAKIGDNLFLQDKGT